MIKTLALKINSAMPTTSTRDQDNGQNAIMKKEGLPSILVAEDGRLRDDHCKKLKENLRLSWLLLGNRKGKTVNFSNWKPLLGQRN